MFDPPHLIRAGKTSWLAKKYGRLNQETWQDDLRRGFDECQRVMKPTGTLVFKWNEDQIKPRSRNRINRKKHLREPRTSGGSGMKILDACCGSRMFWFQKENKYTTFMDIREEYEELDSGHKINVKPAVIGDFRDMPFEGLS